MLLLFTNRSKPRSLAKKIVFVTASLLLCLTSVACSDNNPPQLTPLEPNAVILALGDSLTYGSGGAGISYPKVLQDLASRRVINAGIPGELSKETLARLYRELEKHNPDLVILCIGGNDILRRVVDEKIKHNIHAILDILQLEQIPVILLAVPSPAIFLTPNPIYKEIAQARNIWFEEDIITSVLDNEQLKSDPIHPNAAGYQIIAEEVFSLLKKSGAL